MSITPELRSALVRRSAIVQRALVSVGAAALISLVATAPGGAAMPWWFLFAANGDLWETDGDRLIQVTHGGLFAQPAFGTDALVYVERERNYSDLWLAGPGHRPRQLTHNTAPSISNTHWAAQPVLAPDSDRLYLLSDRDKAATGIGDLAIWALDPPGLTFRQITHPPAYTGGDQDAQGVQTWFDDSSH